MTPFIPVQGTSAWIDNPDPDLPRNWWRAGSPLMHWLASRGLVPLHPEDPFCWSTDLNGWKFWRRLFGGKDTPRDWLAGGDALRWWIGDKRVRLAQRNFWVHSHGLQVLLNAAAEWREPLFAQRVVSFGSPLRDDAPWKEALPKIWQWLIVTDSGFDRVQFLGQLGDGGLGSHEIPLGKRVQILQIPDIDHSRLLQDPRMFSLLEYHGIVSFTTGAWDVVPGAAKLMEGVAAASV